MQNKEEEGGDGRCLIDEGIVVVESNPGPSGAIGPYVRDTRLI